MVAMYLGPNLVKGISFLRLEVVIPAPYRTFLLETQLMGTLRDLNTRQEVPAWGSSHRAWLAPLFSEM